MTQEWHELGLWRFRRCSFLLSKPLSLTHFENLVHELTRSLFIKAPLLPHPHPHRKGFQNRTLATIYKDQVLWKDLALEDFASHLPC